MTLLNPKLCKCTENTRTHTHTRVDATDVLQRGVCVCGCFVADHLWSCPCSRRGRRSAARRWSCPAPRQCAAGRARCPDTRQEGSRNGHCTLHDNTHGGMSAPVSLSVCLCPLTYQCRMGRSARSPPSVSWPCGPPHHRRCHHHHQPPCTSSRRCLGCRSRHHHSRRPHSASW